MMISMMISTAWSMLPPFVIMIALITPSSPYTSSYCYFNQLCTCKQQSTSAQQNYTESATPLTAIQSLLQAPVDIRDVTCLGVPFAQIPGRLKLTQTVKSTLVKYSKSLWVVTL